MDAVGVAGRDLLGDSNGQPRLARAARTGQGDEPRAPGRQQLGEGGQLGVPADEGSGGGGQAARGAEAAQRRELAGQARDHELAEGLRVQDVLEAVHPEVEQGRARGKPAGDALGRRPAQHDLAAVCRRGHARRQVHVEADQVVLEGFGVAGVQAHPHAHRHPLAPRVRVEALLALGRRGHGVRGRPEHHEEAVALRPELPAAAPGRTHARRIRRCVARTSGYAGPAG